MQAQSLETVVEMLEEVTRRAIHDQSRTGYFSALYLRMTRAVHDRIRARAFEAIEVTTRFNIIFANRYFEPLIAHRHRRPISAIWQLAFDACRSSELMILQHLYLGLAGHVIFDLAISAAQAAPGESIHCLKGDFEKINSVVESLMRDVHRDLGAVSPALALLDSGAGALWAGTSQLVTSYVRKSAWESAVRLATSNETQRAGLIAELDAGATSVGRRVIDPPAPVGAIVALVRASESKDVRGVIRAIEGRSDE